MSIQIYEVSVSTYKVNSGLGLIETTQTLSAGLYFNRSVAKEMMWRSAKQMAKSWKVGSDKLNTSREGHITWVAKNELGEEYSFHASIIKRTVYETVDEASHKK